MTAVSSGSQSRSKWEIPATAGVLAGFCLACLAGIPTLAQDSPTDARRQIALEALNRMKGADLEANPTLKKVVLKTLDQVQGTPEYVTLIQDFNIPGHEPGLLDVAIRHPGTDAAAAALQLLLERNAIPQLTASLSGTNAAALVPTLGTSADRRVIGLLAGIVQNFSCEAALRRQAVRALCASPPGTAALMEIIRTGRLAADLQVTARVGLQRTSEGTLKELAGLLPPLKGLGAETLPPISELVTRSGSAARGAEVFRRETVGCVLCHRINGKGVEFGPNLSEVGTKLGKDALYEAILDPSAGIAFGYEGWDIEFKNGEEISGIIVSETDAELAVKVTGGAVTRYPKAEVVSRRKMSLSLMPAGLQQTMSTQDLVDLVEYLSSLKKAASP